ncbi:MAG: RNA polymerase sigma-70 factor [Parabacteroides sp.]|nr:RNA polymerase sigma-70 factor [Parabacteroides sp.]
MGKGDFEDIYERNYKRSFLFVKSYVHDDMAAEDIVTDSLVKYWEMAKLSDCEIKESLLLTILKNKSLDYLRHKVVHETAISDITELENRELNIRISTLAACDPEEIFSEEIRYIVNEALGSLPEQTRRVFVLSRFENKPSKEIAEKLNITVKGVEYHITKALRVLRVSLKDYLPLFYLLFN